jgi:cation:H+ antiporter
VLYSAIFRQHTHPFGAAFRGRERSLTLKSNDPGQMANTVMVEIFPVLFLLLGFVGLYFGAEWLVAGASEIAAHLKISKIFIGLTLVAFGTSAPEMFVNVIAGFHGHSELALSNVVGSNLTNLCIGFGIAALLVTLPVRRREFAPDLIFASLGPILVAVSFVLTADLELSFWALLPMVLLAGVYLISLLRRRAALEPQDPTHVTILMPIVHALLGTLALYVGGRLVFTYAIELAATWQVPENIVGLTIVACGTSIPDVTASVVAARRREFDISIGNILGSNISNVFIVLPGTMLAAGESLAADRALVTDYIVVSALSILITVWCCATERIGVRFGLLLIIGFFTFYAFRIL